MKLRTRLFLLIGSLFFFFAVLAYFLESYLVHENLLQARQDLQNETQKDEQKKRDHFESFLKDALEDFQGEIDVLLYHIQKTEIPFLFQNTSLRWNVLAQILLENKWIDFIQNTKDGEFTSGILPLSSALKPYGKQVISPEFAWIFDDSQQAYFGIRLTSKEIREHLSFSPDTTMYIESDQYLFYDPETLLSLPLDECQEDVYQNFFLRKLVKAQKFLKNHEVYDSEFQAHAYLEKSLSFSNTTDSIQLEFLKKDMIQNLKFDQILHQIWLLTALVSPLDKLAPLGIAADSEVPNMFFSKDVFLEKKIFDDQTYFSKQKLSETINIPPSIALLQDEKSKHLFLANTLNYARNSFLTIGIDVKDLMSELALAANQHAILAEGNEIKAIYNDRGHYLNESIFYASPLSKMRTNMGLIQIKGKNYYFLHLRPMEKTDLHFYLISSENKSFGFISYVENVISNLIKRISLSMRIIGLIALGLALFLLHRISKKVTTPITQLALATKPIAKGEYDKAEIPKTFVAHSKEIRELCTSFQQMVQGLKDKEKVRGVLNKVVSKEIAEEILKGSVHLGGEEREVTILLADIRNFTKLTENMPPTEVIELLNKTMTEITKAVDQYNGVIDKYVGDEAMALFGAPLGDENAAKKAILSAKVMLENMNRLNEQRRGQNLSPINIGIGIHTGVVLAGNMGAENRLNYTVLGSEVNLAARLCEAAKENEILITGNTLAKAKMEGSIHTTKLEPMTFKGFSHPFEVYRIEKIDDQANKS